MVKCNLVQRLQAMTIRANENETLVPEEVVATATPNIRSSKSNGYTRIRLLFDLGSTVNLVSSKVLDRVQHTLITSPKKFVIQGVVEGKDITSHTVAKLELINKYTLQPHIVQAIVVPGCEWSFVPPYPIAPWLHTLKTKAADPDMFDQRSRTTLPMELILSCGNCARFMHTSTLYEHQGFVIRDTVFGYTFFGEVPPPGQVEPKHDRHPFLHYKGEHQRKQVLKSFAAATKGGTVPTPQETQLPTQAKKSRNVKTKNRLRRHEPTSHEREE